MWQSEDHLRRWPIFFKEIGSLSWSPLYLSDKLLMGVTLGALGITTHTTVPSFTWVLGI